MLVSWYYAGQTPSAPKRTHDKTDSQSDRQGYTIREFTHNHSIAFDISDDCSDLPETSVRHHHGDSNGSSSRASTLDTSRRCLLHHRSSVSRWNARCASRRDQVHGLRSRLSPARDPGRRPRSRGFACVLRSRHYGRARHANRISPSSARGFLRPLDQMCRLARAAVCRRQRITSPSRTFERSTSSAPGTEQTTWRFR